MGAHPKLSKGPAFRIIDSQKIRNKNFVSPGIVLDLAYQLIQSIVHRLSPSFLRVNLLSTAMVAQSGWSETRVIMMLMSAVMFWRARQEARCWHRQHHSTSGRIEQSHAAWVPAFAGDRQPPRIAAMTSATRRFMGWYARCKRFIVLYSPAHMTTVEFRVVSSFRSATLCWAARPRFPAITRRVQ